MRTGLDERGALDGVELLDDGAVRARPGLLRDIAVLNARRLPWRGVGAAYVDVYAEHRDEVHVAAVHGERLLGAAWVSPADSFWVTAAVVVDAGHERRGVGGALADALGDVVRALGHAEVRSLDVDPFDERSMAFARATGGAIEGDPGGMSVLRLDLDGVGAVPLEGGAVVRPATTADRVALLAGRAAWGTDNDLNNVDEDDWATEVDSGLEEGQVVVVERHGHVVGATVGQLGEDPSFVTSQRVWVEPAHRGHGFGAALKVVQARLARAAGADQLVTLILGHPHAVAAWTRLGAAQAQLEQWRWPVR